MKNKPKLVFQIILLLSTFISLYFVPWPIVTAWIKPLPNTIQEQVNQASDYGFDGIIVYVNQAGKSPQLYTSGYHNTENKIPAKPDALFKIASNDKLYTSVCIAKLVYDKKIDLNKTLADYFPELVGRIEYANTITIKMMVQHRSGIPNYTDFNNYWANPKYTNEENLKIVLDLPASFKPNTDYEYSNTNYLLLTELFEKVTRKPKFDYIKQHILKPLQLTNTYNSINDININRVMSGYYVGYDKDLKTEDVGMLATAEDLGKFLRALNNGDVFKNKEEQNIYSSIYKYEHTGLVPGYQSIAKYHKDIDAVVIQFTNTVNFEGYNWNLSEVMYGRVVKILKRNN